MKNDNLKQMIGDLKNGTYNLTDNGRCTGCGKCCSNLLPMTDKEISIIHRYIKKHQIKEHKHFLPFSKPSKDITCPFLDDSKKCDKCTIYKVRPTICRNFICCLENRKSLDIKYVLQAKCVNVRETFFGGENKYEM